MGTPHRRESQGCLSVKVQTADMQQGEHHVLSNLGVAASQAFSRKFASIDHGLDAESHRARKEGRKPETTLPPEVLTWLSRGLLEQIVAFIRTVRRSDMALDIAIY